MLQPDAGYFNNSEKMSYYFQRFNIILFNRYVKTLTESIVKSCHKKMSWGNKANCNNTHNYEGIRKVTPTTLCKRTLSLMNQKQPLKVYLVHRESFSLEEARMNQDQSKICQ